MIIAAHYPQVALGPTTCFSIFWVTYRSRTLETDKAAAAAIYNVDVSGLIRIPTSSELVIFLWAGFEPMGEWRDPSLAARWTSLFSPTPTREPFPITKGLGSTHGWFFLFFFWPQLSMWCMPTRERTSSLLFFKNARPKHSWRCTTPEHKPNNGPKRSRNSQECPARSCLLPNRCLERRFFQTFQRRLIRFT